MSNIHTLSEWVLVKPSLDPESRTAAANGSGVNCAGYDRALAILHLGAHDRTTGDEVLDVKIQESSDDAAADAYADVVGGAFAQIGNVVPNATRGNVYLLDIKLTKREQYLRAVGTPGGTSPIDLYGVIFILYRGTKAPVTQDATVVNV
jgi:hypothetical protein